VKANKINVRSVPALIAGIIYLPMFSGKTHTGN
jgi:hypothetical protein